MHVFISVSYCIHLLAHKMTTKPLGNPVLIYNRRPVSACFSYTHVIKLHVHYPVNQGNVFLLPYFFGRYWTFTNLISSYLSLWFGWRWSQKCLPSFSEIPLFLENDDLIVVHLLGSTSALSNGMQFSCDNYSFYFPSYPGRFGWDGGPGPVGPTELNIQKVEWILLFIPSRISQNPGRPWWTLLFNLRYF